MDLGTGASCPLSFLVLPELDCGDNLRFIRKTPMVQINNSAILLAAVGAFVLGYVWFEVVFAKMLAGLDTREVPRPPTTVVLKSMAIGFLSLLMSTYAFALLLELIRERGGTLGQAIMWAWLGFFLPVQLGKMAWESKDNKFITIHSCYDVARLLLTGLLLWNWR
jgi:hypothetical protein